MPPSVMATLTISGLTKTFPDARGKPFAALSDVSLEIAEAQVLCIVGKSGSGKTTFLRLIAGLETPDAGEISLNGQSLTRIPAEERSLAMVFQEPALYPHLSVSENIGLGLRIRKVPRPEAEARVQEAAAMLGIADILLRRPDTLSGGQRQRVALARALVRRPRILLLDEPLSQLDGPLRAQLKRELLALDQVKNALTVWVTHDQAEALSTGAMVAILHQGRLEQAGSPEDIYGQPANAIVAGFLGDPPMNLVRGRFTMESAGCRFVPASAPASEGWQCPAPDKALQDPADVLLGFRPEHAHLSGGSGGYRIRARLVQVEFQGSRSLMRLGWHGQEFLIVGPSAEMKRGSHFEFQVDARAVAIFSVSTGRRLDRG